jgi:hypothetical protein
MALIELTADDLCAALNWPFPCEEGEIIDPVGVAHFLGLVETTAATFDQADAPEPDTDVPAGAAGRSVDPRSAMLSLACSMEASQAVSQARTVAAQDDPERASIKNSIDAFVDGLIASPPVLTTVFPPAGSVVVVGTIVITIPTPPPVHPRWDDGEQLGRIPLLALATRFQSASKMSGVGAAAEDLAGAAARLIDAAMAR